MGVTRTVIGMYRVSMLPNACAILSREDVHSHHSTLSLADLPSIHVSVSMLPNAHMPVRCETFQLVSVVQDIEQTWPTDQVVVVRWAGMSQVHAIGCHLSYSKAIAACTPS